MNRTKALMTGICCIICLPALLSSCKSTKSTTTTTKPSTQPQQTLKAEDFLSHVIDWETFNGKADLHIETSDQDQNVTPSIRMHKGKDIWASVVALGIAEIARGYITPDSLLAIVRIGKKGYALSYQEGLKLIKADVEFPVLQNLFIGNPLLGGVAIANFDVQDSAVRITQKKDDYTQVLTYGKANGTLQELDLQAPSRKFDCHIIYGKYGPATNQQPFAFSRKIVMHNNGQEVKIDMDFSKAELNTPVETNFSIPENYERATIKK
ncbi:MAG: DUF4292 domain-containing protein [Edaphocola sp.]